MIHSRRRRPRLARAGAVLASAGAVAAALLVAPAAADASGPGVPTGLRVTGATSSSFTVTFGGVRGATGYRVYASTARSDIFVANLGNRSRLRTSAAGTGTTITVRNLRYTNAPYYYRVVAYLGSWQRWSQTYPAVWLRPATPGSVAAHDTASGVSLTWAAPASAGAATGYLVDQAADARFTTKVVRYPVRQPTTTFSPYGIARGGSYYLRVYAVNGDRPSPASATVHVVASTGQQPLTVMTYNILSATNDGTPVGNTTVPAWSLRRPGVASLIESARADLVTVQEGAGVAIPYAPGRPSVLQIQQVAADVSSSGLRLDDTTAGPDGSNRYTGTYILYRPASLAPVGSGGYWPLGNDCYAVYQTFRTPGGATFLFVATHLVAGPTAADVATRTRQIGTLVPLATAAARGLPTIYAGDYNAPGQAIAATTATDAYTVARYQYNPQYSSLNYQYLRVPPRWPDNIDHIFVSAGIGVRSAGVMVRLTNGHYVGVLPSDHNPVWATVYVPG